MRKPHNNSYYKKANAYIIPELKLGAYHNDTSLVTQSYIVISTLNSDTVSFTLNKNPYAIVKIYDDNNTVLFTYPRTTTSKTYEVEVQVTDYEYIKILDTAPKSGSANSVITNLTIY